jgi:hypothetical protein
MQPELFSAYTLPWRPMVDQRLAEAVRVPPRCVFNPQEQRLLDAARQWAAREGIDLARPFVERGEGVEMTQVPLYAALGEGLRRELLPHRLDEAYNRVGHIDERLKRIKRELASTRRAMAKAPSWQTLQFLRADEDDTERQQETQKGRRREWVREGRRIVRELLWDKQFGALRARAKMLCVFFTIKRGTLPWKA